MRRHIPVFGTAEAVGVWEKAPEKKGAIHK